MSTNGDVLGIPVPDSLIQRWAHWFAPQRQPFVVPRRSTLARIGREFVPSQEPELRDTFDIYGLFKGKVVRSLTLDEFMSLAPHARCRLVREQTQRERALLPAVRTWPALRPRSTHEQVDGHRFLWWPHLLRGHEREVLVPYIEEGRRPSRQREVTASVWRNVEALLPGARTLAGTFPAASGPNCFGTVMGAAGVENAATTWMQREPFEQWLSDSTRPGGVDSQPGTILVWRTQSGLVDHAAVTLGGGWALHKPSQGWMSPVKVLSVRDVILSARSPGRRLSRRVMAS